MTPRRIGNREKDPDTLQILDESDTEWILLWRKALRKETTSANNLEFIVPPSKKISQQNIKTRAII